MAHAYFSAELNLIQNNKTQAINQFKRALSEYDNFQQALRLAEQGKWSGFYYYDIMTPNHSARVNIRRRLAEAEGEEVPPLQNLIDYREMQHYQKKFSKNFPLIYPECCSVNLPKNNE